MGVVLEAKLFSEEDSDEAKLYGSFLVYSASSAKVTEVRFLGAVVQFYRWAYSKDKSIRRWSSRVSEVKEQRLVRSLESRSTDDGGEEEKTSCGEDKSTHFILYLQNSWCWCRICVCFVVIFRKTNLSRWNICLVTNVLNLRKCPLKE